MKRKVKLTTRHGLHWTLDKGVRVALQALTHKARATFDGFAAGRKPGLPDTGQMSAEQIIENLRAVESMAGSLASQMETNLRVQIIRNRAKIAREQGTTEAQIIRARALDEAANEFADILPALRASTHPEQSARGDLAERLRAEAESKNWWPETRATAGACGENHCWDMSLSSCVRCGASYGSVKRGAASSRGGSE